MTDTDYASWRVSGIGNSVTNIAEIGVIYENGSDTNAPTSFIRLEASDGAGNFLFVGDDNELKITTTKTDIGKVSGPTVVGDQTSDERLKNISSSPFPYGLSEVNAITPIKFTYKDAKVPVDKLGFGAQTMQSIIPESVQQTNDCLDGYDVSVDENGKETYIPKSSNNKMMMQYYQLIPVMVKAIQELSAKVTALENA